ncbi:MAG: retropepsin-like aspartic protease [Taibaiella sp.]|jgi:hypothetical protein
MKNAFYLIFMMLVSTTTFSKEPISLNGGNIEQTKYFEKINYQKIKGKIIVEVSINSKLYKFIFDTGAPFSISYRLFKELSPQTIGKMDIRDPSGAKDSMQIVALPKLNMGSIVFLNTPGLVLPESNSKVFDCLGVDGIIGSNMLRNSVVQFDDQNKQIVITDNAKIFDLKKKQYQQLELSNIQSNPFIKIVLQKGAQNSVDKILFDSGSPDFYDMSNGAHDFFQGRVDVMDKIAEGEGSFTWGVHGFADKQKAYAVNIPELIINNTKFNNVSVTTTSNDESRVGSKLLQYGKTTLDYKNKRFYFEPYENIKPDEPSERVWAIGSTVLNGKKVVGIIWDKSLEGDVNLGDEILKFNDVDFSAMDFCNLIISENSISNTQADIELKDIKTGQIKRVKINRL